MDKICISTTNCCFINGIGLLHKNYVSMLVFPNLPFNTNKIYTSVIDKSGCEIYFPAKTKEGAKNVQIYMKDLLAKQPHPLAFDPKKPL